MADTPWYVDAAMLAATLYGSSQQAEAAKKAAKQQAFGTARAQQLTKEQQQALREDSQAVRQFRNQNLQELSRLNDLQTGRDGFMVSPEYRVTRDAALSVAPGANAPAGLADALSQRANDIATGEYGNYYNRRAQYTQDGANALNNLNSQIQQNTATQQGLYDQYGAQLASGKVGSANATIDGVSGILGLAGKIFGGAGGGDLLGGGIGGGTSPDGSFTMNGTTFDANGNMLAPQSNSFKISDLYSGTGVDSTGKYGYMGDLFSGGGRDGVGNYGLIGDLGGSIKDFFTDGSGSSQGQGGGAGGGINFGNLATGAGGYLLGNLVSGALKDKVDGPLGDVAGQVAGDYAKQLIPASQNYLKTGQFEYKAPDLSNYSGAVGNAVGGIAGAAAGKSAGKWAQNKFGKDTPFAGALAGGVVGNAVGSAAGGAAAGALSAASAGTSVASGAASGAGSALAGPIGWILAGLNLANNKVKAGIVDWGDYADVSAPLKTYEQDKTLGIDVDNERMAGWGYKNAALLSTLSLNPSDWVQGHKYGVEAVKDLASGGSYGEAQRDRAQQKADVSSLAGQGYRMRDSKFDRFLDPTHEGMTDAEWARRMANPLATAQAMNRLGVQPTAGDPIWALWKTYTRRLKGKDMDQTYQNLANRMGDVSLLEKALPYVRNKNQQNQLSQIIAAGRPV